MREPAVSATTLLGWQAVRWRALVAAAAATWRRRMAGRRGALATVALVAGLAWTPAAGAAPTAIFTCAVDTAGGVLRLHPITMTTRGPVSVRVQWPSPTARPRVSLERRRAGGGRVRITSTTGPRPLTLSAAGTAGSWRVAVRALAGATRYVAAVTHPGTDRPSPPFLTLLFSRAAITTATECVPDTPT